MEHCEAGQYDMINEKSQVLTSQTVRGRLPWKVVARVRKLVVLEHELVWLGHASPCLRARRRFASDGRRDRRGCVHDTCVDWWCAVVDGVALAHTPR